MADIHDLLRLASMYGLGGFKYGNLGEFVSDDARRGELGKLYGPLGLSTELSITTTDSRLNQGRPTNIPLLVTGQNGLASLLMGAQPDKAQYEHAVLRALARIKAGAILPSFSSLQEAEKAAENRPLSEKMNPYFREWR